MILIKFYIKLGLDTLLLKLIYKNIKKLINYLMKFL